MREILSGQGRAKFGVTVTLRCLVSGRLETRVVSGPPRAGLQELAAELDARTDGVWVVQVYSTPQTICNDLVRGHDHDPAGTTGGPPENVSLGQIGRLDLCAPELLGRQEPANDRRTTRALRKQAERLAAFAIRERAA